MKSDQYHLVNNTVSHINFLSLLFLQFVFFIFPETHLKARDTYRLKVKDWKKIFPANGDQKKDQKKPKVAVLISDKIDLKIQAVKRDKEEHYILIKGSIQEEDITI